MMKRNTRIKVNLFKCKPILELSVLHILKSRANLITKSSWFITCSNTIQQERFNLSYGLVNLLYSKSENSIPQLEPANNNTGSSLKRHVLMLVRKAEEDIEGVEGS